MKTAVKWLNEQVEKTLGLDEEDAKLCKHFVELALIKEQSQILDAVFYGCLCDDDEIPSLYYKNKHE